MAESDKTPETDDRQLVSAVHHKGRGESEVALDAERQMTTQANDPRTDIQEEIDPNDSNSQTECRGSNKGDDKIFRPENLKTSRSCETISRTESQQTEDRVSKRTDSVNIHYTEDDGYVTGMVVVDKDKLLLLADSPNKCLKLLDIERNKIVSITMLPGEPRDLVLKSRDTCVVAIPDKEIIIPISIFRSEHNASIRLENDIPVNGRCHGMDYDQVKKRFVVSFCDSDHTQIKILDFQGSCLNSWNIERSNEDELQPRPLYVRFLQGGNGVIVSDVSNSTISRFSENVEDNTWTPVTFTSSKPNALHEPRGLFVLSDDKILVAGWHSHNVVLLSKTGEFIRTVVSSDEIKNPCALTCSGNRLYVSTKTVGMAPEDWSHIKCFNVTF